MHTIQLNKNEIRVLRLRNNEISEFVWSLFRATCHSVLNVPEEQEDIAFGIHWNHKNDTLEVYALPFSAIHHVNFNEINAFLEHMTDEAFSLCTIDQSNNEQWCSYNCSKIKKHIATEIQDNELMNNGSVFSKIGGSFQV